MGLLYTGTMSELSPPVNAKALFEECYEFLDSSTESHSSCKILTFPGTAEYQYCRLEDVGKFKIYQGAYGVFAEYSINGKYNDCKMFTDLEELKKIFNAFSDKF